jgi:hypothetical protein
LVNQMGAGMHEIFEGGAEIKTESRLGLRPGKLGRSNAAPVRNRWQTVRGGGEVESKPGDLGSDRGYRCRSKPD